MYAYNVYVPQHNHNNYTLYIIFLRVHTNPLFYLPFPFRALHIYFLGTFPCIISSSSTIQQSLLTFLLFIIASLFLQNSIQLCSCIASFFLPAKTAQISLLLIWKNRTILLYYYFIFILLSSLFAFHVGRWLYQKNSKPATTAALSKQRKKVHKFLCFFSHRPPVCWHWLFLTFRLEIMCAVVRPKSHMRIHSYPVWFISLLFNVCIIVWFFFTIVFTFSFKRVYYPKNTMRVCNAQRDQEVETHKKPLRNRPFPFWNMHGIGFPTTSKLLSS